MTTQEFQQDPRRRQNLLTALNSLDFTLAVRVVLDAAEPLPGDADVNPVLAATRYQQRAGANKFMSDLRKLTEIPKERVIPKSRELAKTRDDIPT